MEKEYLTPTGYSKLVKALNVLIKEKIPECIEDITNSQASGDLSENTEYLNALEERDKIEYKIKELRQTIDNSKIIDISEVPEDGKVRFGAFVTIYDFDLDKEFEYKIVGTLESSIKEGTISYKSPLAKELIGKSIGDVIDLETPNNSFRELEVLKVRHS